MPFAGGWEVHQHRHCIWLVPGESHDRSDALTTLAEALEQAFVELGGSAPITHNPPEWNGRIPLVLGAHLLSASGADVLPRGSILYNVQKISPASGSLKADYLTMLEQHPVLGCSGKNRDELHAAGVKHAGLLEVGFSPVLSRIAGHQRKDVDVLVLGAGNGRASALLTRLSDAGVNVVTDPPALERDTAIARAKIVLHLQDEESGIAEIVPMSYLLANRACLVWEGNRGDFDAKALADGVEAAPYDQLADRCLKLLDQPGRQEELARIGFERIGARRQARLLQKAILEGATPMDPVTNLVVEAAKNIVTNRLFQAERVSADGIRFVNCAFSGTIIVYSGGEVPVFHNCQLSGVSFDFGGAAGNTLQFLKVLIDQNIISGI